MADAVANTSPTLADGRLLLRPWCDADAADLHAAVRESVASVGRWLPWCRDDYGMAQAMAWTTHCRETWQSGTQFAFAARDASSGDLLGGCGLNQLNLPHRSANLGYWVRASRQGHGIATAAARLVARFGFAELGLIRIEIVTLPGNHASRRVAEKLGAAFEGMARHRLWAWDRAHDAALYALIPADLAQPAAAQKAAMSS
ncbi:GNAT family N-acetyltransferase [Rhodanobacter aciditrophus]|uniref:GNAT family N-acetyltransferase n=1 Tax=Rhodanobacter aciditrophus TaxID=1623218 RepID=UPI003CEA2AEC